MLRSLKKEKAQQMTSKNAADDKNDKKAKISLGAWGILIFVTSFILIFLYINSKVEECRAKIMAGFNDFQ